VAFLNYGIIAFATGRPPACAVQTPDPFRSGRGGRSHQQARYGRRLGKADAGAPILLLAQRATWPGFLRGLAWAVLGLLAWVATISASGAQEILTVESNKRLVILTSSTPIEKPAAEIGHVEVIESSTTPRTYRLIYDAPTVVADSPDNVTYAIGGSSRSVQVNVTNRPQPPDLTSEDIYIASFKAIFVLFIIAILLESGLAVIFNWRPFIEIFDTRGVKTIIAFALAYFFVEIFDLDITTSLVNIYSEQTWPVNLPGKIITALVLAGGSSGINNLLTAFGFRSVIRQQQVEAKPKPEEAWVAVRLIRDKAKGSVAVLVGPQGSPSTVAGTITGRSKGNRGWRYFIRDRGRFPTAGGYSVEPEKDYEVKLEGVNETGARVVSPVWGPYKFAKGAIVDLELPL
jgi:hypothetical protein